jgi:predicted RNA-binding Zn-ribbon protein involved in translation (DUF1610 family)
MRPAPRVAPATTATRPRRDWGSGDQFIALPVSPTSNLSKVTLLIISCYSVLSCYNVLGGADFAKFHQLAGKLIRPILQEVTSDLTPCPNCSKVELVRFERVITGRNIARHYYCGDCEYMWEVPKAAQPAKTSSKSLPRVRKPRTRAIGPLHRKS